MSTVTIKDACPDHVWVIDGLPTQRQAEEIGKLLPRAIADGQEVIVHEGMTVRRTDIVHKMSIEEKLLDIEKDLANAESTELQAVRGLIGSAITIVRLWVMRYA